MFAEFVFPLYGVINFHLRNRHDFFRLQHRESLQFTDTMNTALALRGALCHSCRQEALRSFISVSGASIPRYSSTRLPGPIHRGVNGTRAFLLTSRPQSQESSSAVDTGSNSQPVEENDARVEDNASQPSQHIPWYLQDMPSAEPRLVTSRDQIPDLPENAPPILPALLDYTFKDLGLDDLKLLDLRHLDQPPALGAHVIMLIGTARSVKHLNVSADRLCRWLRSNYKLSPHADGLLGRNELKIKLRRKARRARIASQAGAVFDDKDDGITTGWICVNAGIVEDPYVQQFADVEIEGFGSAVRGTRIAIQMFTEEKRTEVDLEGFWEAALRRSERNKQAMSEGTSDSPDEEVRVPSTANGSTSDHDLSSSFRAPVSTPFNQSRGMHTARRVRVSFRKSSGADDEQPSRKPLPADDLDSSLVREGFLSQFHLDLLRNLSELSDEQVRIELGSGPDDRDSTVFLRLFHRDSPSAEEAAVAYLRLICVAISRRHVAYSKKSLYYAFKNYLGAAYRLPDELGYHVLSTMLTEPRVDHPSPEQLPVAHVKFALRIVDHLSLRGVDVLNWQVFTMLYQAASRATRINPPNEQSTRNIPEMSRGEHSGPALISRAVEVLNLPMNTAHVRAYLAAQFQNQDYDGFWRTWRRIPLYGERTAADYELLFRLHAELGDSRRARDCLAWEDTMWREAWPGFQRPIRENIEACRRLVSATYSSQNAVMEKLAREPESE